MIRFERVTFAYDPGTDPVLAEVDLHLEEGELVLVVGPTGAGKSTLLGLVNGLVPHFTGGRLRGRVSVGGRDTATHPPRALADLVGWVGQDPAAGFVTDTVEEELAYGMEQLGLAPDVMRRRVEETLDLLGIVELRRRALGTLSGGQAQRVAVGSVLGAHPRVLVLDEPTSALDPVAAEDVLATLARLVHDLGLTVVVAEHRLERVAHHADRVVHVDGRGTVTAGAPGPVLARHPELAPPVVALAALAGWEPPPLSVRDARRRAGDLRRRLAGRSPGEPVPPRDRPPLCRARGLHVAHGPVTALAPADLDLHPGEVVAVMGRNGAGKSSLLWALADAAWRSGGSVALADGAGAALVPQTPGDLLYLATVGEELAQADADAGARPGTAAGVLAGLGVELAGDRHPRDLSEGQRLALVLAVQLATEPSLVLLDEPTRGLDPVAKAGLVAAVASLAAAGRAVVVATHDVELAAAAAHRVVVLAGGEVVVDGPVAEVVCSSPAFAPQVAKILAPERWLTVEDVARALVPALRRP